MKITHVEVFPVEVPGAKPWFHWRKGLAGSPDDYTGAVLRIGTDTGASGVAFMGRAGADIVLTDLVNRRFRDELVGVDPLQREFLYHRVWEVDRIEELPLPYPGVVDVALWDLAARLANVPVWQLLGGARTSIPVYASTSTFDTIDEFLTVADRALELCYHGVKLHAFGDARKDAELCFALRDRVGPDVPLMYDGSAGFDLPDAIRLGHALAEADFLWYEEPMREFSVTSYAQLAREVRIPLLSAETVDGAHYTSADYVRAGAATYGLRTSAILRGGISGAMRVAHLADAFQIRAEVHGSGFPEQHLCMAIQNNTYYESFVTSLDFQREAGVTADGMLLAPVGPGISLPRNITLPATLQEYVNPVATEPATLQTLPAP